MAQSTVTCTPPSPTPPTNFGAGIANPYTAGTPGGAAGSSAPPAAAYASTVYNDPWHPGVPFAKQTGNTSAMSGVTDPTVPPFLDDGAVSAGQAFAAPNSGNAAEGAGSETVATQTYASGILIPGSVATYLPNSPGSAWAAGDPGGPLRTFSDLGTYCDLATAAGVSTSATALHASSLSPVTNPTLVSISPTSTVSGAGTQALTCTGTNFTRQSVIYVNGVAQVTSYVSATSLTATPQKKSSAGTWPVTVVTGGAVTTAPQTWTFT